MARAKTTTDHDTIKRWVQERDGYPAYVKGTSDGDPGSLRIDYPGVGGEQELEEITWEEFFEAFEENDLAFLYQDDEDSRFSKLVSRSSNGTDAVELLEQQHREVEDMFEELEDADSDDARWEAFLRIANALAAHSKIEETLFYPVMLDEDTEDDLRESVEEHLVVKRILVDMLEMEPSNEQFEAKASVLKDVVEHHVEQEEDGLFEIARTRDDVDLDRLGSEMEQRYQELMAADPADALRAETRAAAELSMH